MQARSLDCSWHMWAMLHQVLSISNPWLPLCPPLCLCHHPLSTKFLPQFHTTTRVPQQATLSSWCSYFPSQLQPEGSVLKTRMMLWSRTKSLGLWSCMGLTLPVHPLVGGRGQLHQPALRVGLLGRTPLPADDKTPSERLDGQSAYQGLPVEDPLVPSWFPWLMS